MTPNRNTERKTERTRRGSAAQESFVAAPSTAVGSSASRAVPTAKKGTGSGVDVKKTSAIGMWWETWKPHVRKYGPQILINHGATIGVIAVIAVIVGIGAGFSIIPATIGSLWMVFNLAPVTIGGAELGFSPLLPAMILVAVHSRRATATLGNSISVRGLRVFATLSLLIPALLTCIAWLMIWDASGVYDVSPPNLLTALVATVLVNGASVVIGMRPRVWRALLLRRQLSTWPVEAFRLAGRFLGWMTIAGAVAALISLLTNLNAFESAYAITSDTLGVIGLSLVALAYLPNIALGGAAVLLGGEFHIGNGAVSLFTADNVNLPPVPILAAIPNQTIPYGGFLLLVPAVVSVATVYGFVRKRGYIEAPALLAIGSGAAAAFIGFCAAWLSGGELGVYGNTGPLVWLFAVELAVWLLVPAAVIMVVIARAGDKVVEDVPDGPPSEDNIEADNIEADNVEADNVEAAEDNTEAGKNVAASDDKGESPAEPEDEQDTADTEDTDSTEEADNGGNGDEDSDPRERNGNAASERDRQRGHDED